MVIKAGHTFDQIVFEGRMYELLRFWLLGTWMAKTTKQKIHARQFGPGKMEEGIVTKFSEHIVQDTHAFQRATWRQSTSSSSLMPQRTQTNNGLSTTC